MLSWQQEGVLGFCAVSHFTQVLDGTKALEEYMQEPQPQPASCPIFLLTQGAVISSHDPFGLGHTAV